MIPPLNKLVLLVVLACLTSCAGYHLGIAKPAKLAHVNTIAVEMFGNASLHPRAEAIATSAVANAIVLDGTYRIVSVDHADAVLEGRVDSITYSSISNNRLDTLRPEELVNTVTLKWTLHDAKNPGLILMSGTSSATSQLFVTTNLQTARNNALPDAFDRAATVLVSILANGY